MKRTGVWVLPVTAGLSLLPVPAARKHRSCHNFVAMSAKVFGSTTSTTVVDPLVFTRDPAPTSFVSVGGS